MTNPKRWGPFSGTQLTIIVCTAIVTVLFPIGAWAVAGSPMFVTDATSGIQAGVAAGGRLQVDPTPDAQKRFLLFLSNTTRRSIGSLPAATTAAVTHVTLANYGTAIAEIKLGGLLRTSGTSTCAQGLAGAAGFASVSDYTVLVVGPNSTVDQDFATGGIPLGTTKTGTLLCPFAQAFRGSPFVTVIESS